MRTLDLFEPHSGDIWQEPITEGVCLLHGFALASQQTLVDAIDQIAAAAPWRHMQTPGGFRMSVAMTNCGGLGWVSDRRGYRYDAVDPLSGLPWPRMPEAFAELARRAADAAGFDGFDPDACLVNRYTPGARMSLHQDKNEPDIRAPIVSVSLGLPAMFQFGGEARSDKPRRLSLQHGDVVVWGGPARLRYHGVLPLKEGEHALLGAQRINLTFRRAGESLAQLSFPRRRESSVS